MKMYTPKFSHFWQKHARISPPPTFFHEAIGSILLHDYYTVDAPEPRSAIPSLQLLTHDVEFWPMTFILNTDLYVINMVNQRL